MNSDQHPAVEIDHVSYTYPASGLDAQPVSALQDISFKVDEKTKLGVLGPNGGGKSTLIKLILGIIVPNQGKVKVFGLSPTKARAQGLVGYLPQRIESDLDWPISVEQVVAFGRISKLKPWQRLGKNDLQSIQHAMELVDVLDLANRHIGSLSGGQLQRVMIARAIAGNPKLLVLDEPTVGVDIAGQQRFGKMIETLQSELGLTVIVVTHDMRAIAAMADRIACLSRSLHFHDAPQGLTPGVLAQVFAHDVAGVFGDIHIDAHRADECEDPSHTIRSGCGCDEHDCSDQGENK
ncbi:MAG: metal ABC transporter ATP-binding protein [Phycisphaerales bacterium]|nr:metal ABC transporter ATP-binding protein [Phycisphaerales bacterium]